MSSKQQENSKQRSCWTCKDRKVRCDGFFPSCINCTRARRECVRSVVRLSWPKSSNKRRFIISDKPLPSLEIQGRNKNGSTVFLNTSQWDITLHKELSRKGISPTHFNAWSYEVPKQLSRIPRTGPDGQALLSYFDSPKSRLLTPHGVDGRITHFLLRIAFNDETPASAAVLQGILALSSLKLYGSVEASPFQTRAMSMLSASLKIGMDFSEFIRSLAASLLLGSYQISSTTDLSIDWTFFVCGAIKIVKAMSLPRVLGSEETLLLNWLSCHTILARFSLSHWLQRESCVYREPCVFDPQLSIVYSHIPDRSRIVSFLGCSLEFLEILSSICSAVLPQTHPDFLSESHRQQLDSLELRLRSLQQNSESAVHEFHEQEQRTKRVAELYRLAGLAYLHRAARRTSANFPPTETVIKEAFSILEWLGRCESPWPLFIIGCEARSDEQRLKILEIFSRTLQVRDMGNIRSIKKMVEAAWIQDDLCEEEQEEVDYLSRINSMISAHGSLPTFI